MVAQRTLKFILIFSALLAFLSQPNPSQAGGGLWSVWLFTNGDKTDMTIDQPLFVRVFEDGVTKEYAPDIPEGTFLQFPRFGFSSDGNWMAYCTTTSDPFHVDLHIVSTDDGASTTANNTQLPITYPLDTAVNCLSIAFAEENDITLAVSVQNNIVGNETPSAAPPEWEILIFDLQSVSPGQRLTAVSPGITALASFPSEEVPPLPEIRYYDDNNVIFTLMPQGGYYDIPIHGYLWETTSGVVKDMPSYNSRFTESLKIFDESSQTFYTETLWTQVDQTFPITTIQQPPGTEHLVTPSNVVMYDNDHGAGYPVFTQSDGVWQSVFINNGRHIALMTHSSGVMALDRTGVLHDLPVDVDAAWTLAGVRDGYVFLTMSTDPITTQMLYHTVHEEATALTVQTQTIWQNSEYQGWQIVWHSEMPVMPDLPYFTSITP